MKIRRAIPSSDGQYQRRGERISQQNTEDYISGLSLPNPFIWDGCLISGRQRVEGYIEKDAIYGFSTLIGMGNGRGQEELNPFLAGRMATDPAA